MRKTKFIILLLSLILSFGNFQNTFADFTDSDSNCTLTGPNLISENKPPYIEYDNKDADTEYSQYLQKLKINQSISDGNPLDKAKIIYRETQNLIFNCAILNSKLKIGQKIITTMKGKGETNSIKKIENQNSSLKSEIKNSGCSSFSDNDILTKFKITLLENVTYQNCIYRFYLKYIGDYMKDNLQPVLKNNPGVKLNTNTIPAIINKSSADISNEIVHSRTVYNQALIAFSEFENTYGIHIMLLFIYDDYITIRNNLDKMLAPLSQLFYKIPNAMKG